MSHHKHARTEFEPDHAESAEANGIIADPPGRSPAEVDDSALRGRAEHSSNTESAEDR